MVFKIYQIYRKLPIIIILLKRTRKLFQTIIIKYSEFPTVCLDLLSSQKVELIVESWVSLLPLTSVLGS